MDGEFKPVTHYLEKMKSKHLEKQMLNTELEKDIGERKFVIQTASGV